MNNVAFENMEACGLPGPRFRLSIQKSEVPMIAKKLKSFLDERKVKYYTIAHSPAYTAAEVAASAHISGRVLAKTVMIVVDGAMAMAVLPANHRVLLDDLCELTGTDDVRLAREEEFKDLFPDCELGAMPPFGNLYDMSVYVSADLADEAEIAFNAGTHTDIISMGYHDFDRLVRPKVANFTT
jgi:Ala-tRNA(Pro) deacylase